NRPRAGGTGARARVPDRVGGSPASPRARRCTRRRRTAAPGRVLRLRPGGAARRALRVVDGRALAGLATGRRLPGGEREPRPPEPRCRGGRAPDAGRVPGDALRSPPERRAAGGRPEDAWRRVIRLGRPSTSTGRVPSTSLRVGSEGTR